MKTKVAINGFGRIGRCLTRILADHKDLELVAINCSWELANMAYLLRHDSVHGNFSGTVEVADGALIINGRRVAVTAEREVSKIGFERFGAVMVFECTGAFLTAEKCQPYLDAGIAQVIMSAPPKDETKMFVMDVNHTEFAGERIISNASCTTNCLAPLVAALHAEFGIKSALMNTIHAYTATQEIHDTKCAKDIRRGRAAACNLVPSSTGAAKSIGRVIPALAGKIDGQSVRTSLANVSMVDLTFTAEKPLSREGIDACMRKAAAAAPEQIAIDDEKCVSGDFCTTTHGCVYVADTTQTIGSEMAKVLAWYDNEWAYSYQLARLGAFVASQGSLK